MRVADTSALWALFSETDVHHGEARAAFSSLLPVIVPREVLAETLRLIRLRHGGERARAAREYLLSLPNVDVQETDDPAGERARRLFLDAEGALSFADAVVVAWCCEEELAPLAYGAALRRLLCRDRRLREPPVEPFAAASP